MNLQEMMKQFLQEEGFCPKETDFGLAFKCEGKNYLFIYDDDDAQYFRLMMPCIYETTEENEDEVFRAMNEVNTPVVGDFVPRAIGMLNGGARKFFQALQEG